jgi:hypothetical protein
MVIYVVSAIAFILGANVGVFFALLLLHGKAESLAESNARACISDVAPPLAEESLTAAYL